ncbi:MAG TPA: hypothetical protein VLA02_07920 [Reyranella sp.]|nr:hypothetical protein [Reyranella sp.]
MRPFAFALALLVTLASIPALAQSAVRCGPLKADVAVNGQVTRWTVDRGSEKTTETGTLRNAPRFECLDGAVLTVEVAFTAGHGSFSAYFPDGTDITYGRHQIDRRNNRIVLPIQAKARIARRWRAAFDYHCKLEMPADPIPAASRAECVF